jgi:murein DD-endopeptidase MepM/ murein hydrolase activator NlpD
MQLNVITRLLSLTAETTRASPNARHDTFSVLRTSITTISAILLFVASIQPAIAQSETKASSDAMVTFTKHFNNEAYDSVFTMFSEDMKKALPIEKTTQVLGGVTRQLGKIQGHNFIAYERSYATYKTQFEKAVFQVNISLDSQAKMNGLFFKPYTEASSTVPARNTTKMSLPFKGEWFVVWGGDTKEQNYHVSYPPQKNAFDILIRDSNGKTFKTNGRANEDYYAFGKELFSPCDGEVVTVIEGVNDNIPGQMNKTDITGNTVVIKTKANEFVFLCHFQNGSIKVKTGQQIIRGQSLGLCGNSGNSSEAHLHLHLQNSENMLAGTGIKCFFDKATVNGEIKEDYSPVRGEKIRP